MAKRGETRKAARGRRKHTPMESLMAYLKAHPRAPYAEAQKVAARKGHKVYPIMYGRAQALLGLAGKKGAGRKGGARKVGSRGRRAGRKAAAANGALGQLQAILDDYAALRRERDALRDAVDAVREAAGRA